MHIRLREVGNSRGIIIPAAMLAACKMRDVVDVRLEGKSPAYRAGRGSACGLV